MLSANLNVALSICSPIVGGWVVFFLVGENSLRTIAMVFFFHFFRPVVVKPSIADRATSRFASCNGLESMLVMADLRETNRLE